jgi:hypothetical protein
MQLIEKLLSGVTSQDLKDYESYTQLHLKQILTTINKHKLEDTVSIKVRVVIDRKGSISVMSIVMIPLGTMEKDWLRSGWRS